MLSARQADATQGLTEPQHWDEKARACVAKCSELVEDALRGPPGTHTIRSIDRISDTVGTMSCG